MEKRSSNHQEASSLKESRSNPCENLDKTRGKNTFKFAFIFFKARQTQRTVY